jgi:hypothetical protein
LFGVALYALALVVIWKSLGSGPKREDRDFPRESEDAPQSVPNMSIRDLFFHVHPHPFAGEEDKEAVGREVIEKFAIPLLSAWGQRIQSSRRLPLTLIETSEWQRAKFTYWFLEEGNEQSMHVEVRPSVSGVLPHQYGNIRVNRQQAENIWQWLPLKDAARICYEQTRGSPLSAIAEHEKTANDKLVFFANTIVTAIRMIYGQTPPSTLYEEISDSDRANMRVLDDCNSIGRMFGREPSFINVRVLKSDLDGVIEWAKTTGF